MASSSGLLSSPDPPIALPSSTSHYFNLIFVTGFAFLLISILLFLLITRLAPNSSKPLNLPPGPTGWPIFGNLFQVLLSAKPFIHYVRDLHAIYGPIFTLRMGSRTIIIVTSPDLAHEALITKGQLFASRPSSETPTRSVFSCNKFTVNSALYGPEWRSLRKNLVSGMLSSARIREFRPARESAMDQFIHRIRAEAEANDGAVWVLKNARFAVFVILLTMCFGLHLDEDSIVKVDQLMKKVLIALTPRMDDYLPLLRPFFAKQFKQILEVRKEQIQTIVGLINKRRAILKDPHRPDALPFSYLDSLLDLKVDGRSSAPNDVELVSLCSEFINGGTDTTGTAVEWAIARMIENPSIQTRLYDEISATVGDRAVDEKDTEKMVYLQAFVKELLRKHPPTYFALTHAASEPGAKISGYDVPFGANLEVYLPTIAEDPKLWSNPERFDPDRFLSGGETADITGVTGIRMMPFGAGRRLCPGLAMGMTHITLMVARMVQAFEWRAHPSQPVMDFYGKLEFTVVMEKPLLARARPRVN